MQGGRSVGIQTIIRFNHDEAGPIGIIAVIWSGGGVDSGVEANGGVAQCAGIGGEGCSEAGGIEIRALRRGAVNDAVVAQVSQHFGLGRGEVGFAIGLAELEAAEHEEKGQHIHGVHPQLKEISLALGEGKWAFWLTYLLGILKIEN